MKITHTPTGRDFDLAPDTALEFERSNIFFNDYGEFSFPADLPDTPNNRQLTDYPHHLQQTSRPPQMVDCTISAGGSFFPAKMTVLEASRDDKITVTFAVNQGSFLSKIKDVSLQDILGRRSIPEVNTVTEAINFCDSLWANLNPNYTIFTVAIDTGGTFSENNAPAYVWLNRYGVIKHPGYQHGPGKFYNATARTETVNEKEVNLAPGFYITPFMRLGYALEIIFTHFGYRFLKNPFRQNGWQDIVLLNPIADVLVTGKIHLVDLMPDCMVSTFLDAVRKKFNCDFATDEITRTVSVVFLKDIISSPSRTDLTPYLSSHPTVEAPDSYRQLRIRSEKELSEISSADSFSKMRQRTPWITYDPMTGNFEGNGCRYKFGGGSVLLEPVAEVLGDSTLQYFEGGEPEALEISVPDAAVPMVPTWLSDADNSAGRQSASGLFPFAGQAIFRYSAISAVEERLEEKEEEKNDLFDPMFCWAVTATEPGRPPYIKGTVTDTTSIYNSRDELYIKKVKPFSLAYNGPNGIFETFYRSYDSCCRNSLLKITAELLLPASLQLQLQPYLGYQLEGQPVLMDRLNLQLNRPQVPVTAHLLTVRSYAPVRTAPTHTDIFKPDSPDPGNPNKWYDWAIRSHRLVITKEEYDKSTYKGLDFPTFYPPAPSRQLLGKKLYPYVVDYKVGSNYYRDSLWLECVEVDFSQ